MLRQSTHNQNHFPDQYVITFVQWIEANITYKYGGIILCLKIKINPNKKEKKIVNKCIFCYSAFLFYKML